MNKFYFVKVSIPFLILLAANSSASVQAQSLQDCSGSDWNVTAQFFVGRVDDADVATFTYSSSAKPNCAALNQQVAIVLPTQAELEVQPEPAEEWFIDLFESSTFGPVELSAIEFDEMILDGGTVTLNFAAPTVSFPTAELLLNDLMLTYYSSIYPSILYSSSKDSEPKAQILFGQKLNASAELDLGSLLGKVTKAVGRAAKKMVGRAKDRILDLLPRPEIPWRKRFNPRDIPLPVPLFLP